MRKKGRIVSWNAPKAYGFIAPAGGGAQLFVHQSMLEGGRRRARAGLDVTYEEAADEAGRPRAIAVRPAGWRWGPALTAFLVAAAVLLAVAALAAHGLVPLPVAWWYGAASLLTFCIYALDKSAARNGARRTPETTLHLLALAGGWPGALYAQELLRHKSRKRAFRIVFALSVVANAAALGWLVSEDGRWLRELIAKAALVLLA